MSKANIQDERHKLMNEIFDLYDTKHTGYVDIKDSLRMLASMGKKLEPEDENDFLMVADPNKEGVISKQNFLKGVEILLLPDIVNEDISPLIIKVESFLLYE